MRAVLVTVAGLAVVLALAWGAVNSSLFRARTIEVSGNERLSRARVLAIADLDGRANVLRMSPGTVEERLEREPLIAEATVSRRPPSTVTIALTERVPVAVARVGGEWATLASDGTVVARGRRRPALTVLRVAVGDVQPGGRVRRGREALTLLARLPDEVRPAEVRADRTLGWRLRLPGGAEVLYGTPTAWRAKNEVLRSILRWAGRRGETSTRIDVRVPEAPAVAVAPS